MTDLRSRTLGVAYEHLARPFIFRLGKGDAEAAHHTTMRMTHLLGAWRLPRSLTAACCAPVHDPVEVMGVRFPNRVGLAAGTDKDALAMRSWQPMGFGHMELGTVTPRPQPGNPRPRLYRLASSGAVINRMGFNNAGVDALAGRLRRARRHGWLQIPVGVSIGKNKATPLSEATADYLACVRALAGLVDYLAVNVSSPNTPGLRGLQDAHALESLLTAVVAQARRMPSRPTPVAVKVAPDLTNEALRQVVRVAQDAGVAAIIAGNTTLARNGVHPRDEVLAEQVGGLSGAPLGQRAQEVVSEVAQAGSLPIIGVGGVMRGGDAAALRAAGADLVQLYTGLVYRGPALVREAAQHAR